MWKLILTKLRKRSYKKIIDEVEPPPQSTEEQQQSLETVNRTCSVSMNKIIRSDLPPEIRDILTKKLQETMSRVSNYIANLSEAIFLTMLLFKNGSIVFKDGELNYDWYLKGLNLPKNSSSWLSS